MDFNQSSYAVHNSQGTLNDCDQINTISDFETGRYEGSVMAFLNSKCVRKWKYERKKKMKFEKCKEGRKMVDEQLSGWTDERVWRCGKGWMGLKRG